MIVSRDLLLALHSSSDTLGVALQLLEPGANAEPPPPQVATFPLGRQLSNELFGSVEQLCPAEQWGRLRRLAVATGPGGFTGTRLTVVLARTLAQQLRIPLDGVGSFPLIAHRLWCEQLAGTDAERFWLVQVLPRRGVVAGCYGADPSRDGAIHEWMSPRFFPSLEALPPEAAHEPRLDARVEAAADVARLLEICLGAEIAQLPGPWEPVLPLYPTSPVAMDR